MKVPHFWVTDESVRKNNTYTVLIRSLVLLGPILFSAQAAADDTLFHNRTVSCVANTSNVVRMWVDHVRFILVSRHPSAHARVHLQLRDNSEVAFDVSGEAVHIAKDLVPNSDGRSLSYAGVDCTLVHRSITSIQNCNGTEGTRICEVGLQVAGHQRAYLVSLSITPIGDQLTVRGQ